MKILRMAKLIAAPWFALVVCLALLGAPSGTLSHLTPPREPVPSTFFGMHIHNAADRTPWPSIPIPEWRLWDAHVQWPQLEPRPGQWNFAVLDRYVALAQQHHAGILLPLGLSPTWASARPQERSVYSLGFAAEPRDTEAWRKYVEMVVNRYKGRIGAYEIWNEPNSKNFWTGDTQGMVTLTREAYTIIHRADPGAIVVSPAATTASGVEWLNTFLRDGGAQYVDAIGYHFYVAPMPPEAMVPLIQKVRQVMMDNGAGDKPLWNTESGWHAPKPFPPGETGPAYLARAYILSWAADVRRFYWYAWDNHIFVALETTERDNQTLTPAGRAYEEFQKWLVGAEMNRCDEDSDHTWICELSRSGSPSWIVWNPVGAKNFSVPRDWHATTATPLLAGPTPISGANLEVGPTPQLVSASAR